MMKTTSQNCGLCHSPSPMYYSKELTGGQARDYYKCPTCDLIFLDPSQHVSSEEEKRQYDFHNNSPDHQGYVRFLEQLTIPLSKELSLGAQGLDFGSGPGPTLNQVMEKNGYLMRTYDPIYNPDDSALDSSYDFITCTEVVEHFRAPLHTFTKLIGMIRNNGIIAIMTRMVQPSTPFSNWWYHRDPTHICFYSKSTFDWISNHFSLRVIYPAENIVFFRPTEN